MAKRFRDTGADGWTSTIIWTILLIAIPQEWGIILSLPLMLYLLLVPSKKL